FGVGRHLRRDPKSPAEPPALRPSCKLNRANPWPTRHSSAPSRPGIGQRIADVPHVASFPPRSPRAPNKKNRRKPGLLTGLSAVGATPATRAGESFLANSPARLVARDRPALRSCLCSRLASHRLESLGGGDRKTHLRLVPHVHIRREVGDQRGLP